MAKYIHIKINRIDMDKEIATALAGRYFQGCQAIQQPSSSRGNSIRTVETDTVQYYNGMEKYIGAVRISKTLVIENGSPKASCKITLIFSKL
jgi:hypothetical protein